ncbi:hypothetical protein K2O51_34715 (plasmid) [Cupriavidus pinatubonensis]|uniref:hypothetical protein n=1 Tax=Cupriavidus pinatubonensis TaxID=248026 RepID=UPI001C73965D|nr:hypothetical protein [Cupriavidus pinatubonensis]QYY33949.1 hypothetical protein K2O51_34715 [Cupriavidus pinatubonensis]
MKDEVTPVNMNAAGLPDGFQDLESFLDQWNVSTSHERWVQRAATPYPEIIAFYDAMLERADAAVAFLDQFPIDDMPAPAQNLFRLMLSMCHASIAVEMHQSSDIRNAPQQHGLRIHTGFQPHG